MTPILSKRLIVRTAQKNSVKWLKDKETRCLARKKKVVTFWGWAERGNRRAKHDHCHKMREGLHLVPSEVLRLKTVALELQGQVTRTHIFV